MESARSFDTVEDFVFLLGVGFLEALLKGLYALLELGGVCLLYFGGASAVTVYKDKLTVDVDPLLAVKLDDRRWGSLENVVDDILGSGWRLEACLGPVFVHEGLGSILVGYPVLALF